MSNEDKDTNKYAVRTSLYNTLKFGNTSLKNTEVGLNKMLEYFSDYYTKEQLLDNIANYNLDTMFNDVKSYFYSEYNFDATNVELVNLYQRYITSFVCHNKENSEDSIILHIDELLESTMLSFFIAMFKWSNDFNDLEVYGECFKYVLYLLNDVCIFGEMQGEDANRMLLSLMKNDIHDLQTLKIIEKIFE